MATEKVILKLPSSLVQLEKLTTPELWAEARGEMSEDHITRYDALLEARNSGDLDSSGRQELAELHEEADFLMFRKAYAALLLQWRGERIPSLSDLERPGA